MLAAALLGFVFGFFGSMPIAGPIAALVFSRGLENRGRSALYLAAGAAIAEAGYAYLAFWGFAAFLSRHAWVEPTSRAFAALLLTALGVHFTRKGSAKEGPEQAPDPNVGNKRSFFLGFTITALNPTLIATWTGAVTFVYSLDVVTFDSVSALPFSVGSFAGIVCWFALLLGLLARFRARFPRETLGRVMRWTGFFLIGLGLLFAARFVQWLAAH
jgi:threonine/homoserine/homoserine lactone efflux protein